MDVEQTETTEGSLSERDELMAAVREAGGTESVDVDAEAVAAGSAPPEKAAAATTDGKPAEATDEPRIAAILRDREDAFKKTQAAEDRAARLLRESEERAASIIAEAKERARLEHDQWLAEKRRRFQESPTEHIRSLGDPDRIADIIIQDGTPEARRALELEARIAKAEEKGQTADQVKAELEAMKAAIVRERQEQHEAQVRQLFMGSHANKDKAPYLHVRYDEDEIFTKANALATTWQKTGLVLGKDFDFDDVATYLEHDAKKRITAAGVIAPQQVGGAAPQNGAGTRPQGLANGSRTLSAAAGSERRASPKPVSEMTPEEERQALMDEVAKARRTIKDTSP